jgi:DNA-binding NarL/FixJ family response regulator
MSAFQAIIDIAGRDAATRVAELRGGAQIYIPRTVRVDHWLAKAIGHSNATAIAKEFGGCRVEIPADTVQRRHANIVALFDRGLTVAEVARELNINVRTARRHRPRRSTLHRDNSNLSERKHR